MPAKKVGRGRARRSAAEGERRTASRRRRTASDTWSIPERHDRYKKSGFDPPLITRSVVAQVLIRGFPPPRLGVGPPPVRGGVTGGEKERTTLAQRFGKRSGNVSRTSFGHHEKSYATHCYASRSAQSVRLYECSGNVSRMFPWNVSGTTAERHGHGTPCRAGKGRRQQGFMGALGERPGFGERFPNIHP